MKQLAVISGKGGTGKTILSACFAVLAESKVMVDCDVDAANLHLLLKPEIKRSEVFISGQTARLDGSLCTGCGECLEACRFDAVSESGEGEFRIDPLACEGCAVCSHVCPSGAIDMEDAECGHWFVAQTQYGPFVYARLGIGAENSGKLVTEVRNRAVETARTEDSGLVLIDGPPGIGCPVIATLSGVDLALVVTEPTPSGIQDMERVIATARHFQIKTACCINKHDLNPALTGEIEAWCTKQGIAVVGTIPYDHSVVEAMVQAIPPVEILDNATADRIRQVWGRVHEIL